MLSRRPLGVFSAAMLGIVALLGTNAANAVIFLDGEDMGGVTYAQETITEALQGRDGGTYYVVDGGDEALDVTAALGFGTLQTASLVVRYDFTGMILTAGSLPVLTVAGTTAVTLRQGGKAKDSYVVYLVTGFTGPIEATAPLALTLEEVAISTGGGSINMHVTDDLSIPAENRASHSGAVTMKSALMSVKTPNNPIALVSEKFLLFEGTTEPVQTATLGNVVVSLVPGTLDADDGSAASPLGSEGGDTGLLTLGGVGVNTTTTDIADTMTSVVFMGDFSFVSRAWLDDTMACDDETTDLRIDMDEETMTRDTTRLKAQSLTYVNDNSYLCIMVLAADSPMAVAIPETTPYMVAKNIVLAGAYSASKFAPMPAPAPLGAIMRNGTTVHIPYVTQFANYNQRIVIVNRGAEATYSFSFMTEDGVTATPGADAEGTLAANSTTYLSLMNHDVVTIEGPFNRASATLIVEREPSYIDVVVSQTNANGGTDTVKYTPND